MTVVLPTPTQLRAVAEQCGLSLTDEDVASFRGLMQGSVDAYNLVAQMPDELPEVKYPRTPGTRPAPEENKHNAWYRKSTVKGAASGKLKGKTVAASAPGTSPYFALAWMLKRNGLSVKDVTVVNLEPAAAAQAFVSGQNDAAMTYEPYLSTVRAAPDKGKIIATTLDYPIVMDTFGCTPKFLTDNPKAAQALANSYFEALDMIAKDQAKAYEIMGADVKQTGEQFGNSAKYLRWQDKAANQKFFAGDFLSFNKDAAELLLEVGIIKAAPKVEDIYDASFIK